MRHGLMIISQASPNAFCFSSQKLNYEKQFDGRIWGLSGLLYTCTFMLLGAHLGTSFSEAFRVLLVKLVFRLIFFASKRHFSLKETHVNDLYSSLDFDRGGGFSLDDVFSVLSYE